MLVCSVSLRARRSVAAIIVEAGGALDNVNTLGLGQLVSEAASAAAITDALAAYRIAIVEPASAGDAPDATAISAGVFAGTVAETTTAADAPDAAMAGGAPARSAMAGTVFVNSDGTPRQANADGTMVNL